MMIGDDDTASPLEIRNVREGDLRNVITVDQFDASVQDRIRDPYDRMYGQPQSYLITLRRTGDQIYVHPSRVIRFDGLRPLSSVGWEENLQRVVGGSRTCSAP